MNIVEGATKEGIFPSLISYSAGGVCATQAYADPSVKVILFSLIGLVCLVRESATGVWDGQAWVVGGRATP